MFGGLFYGLEEWLIFPILLGLLFLATEIGFQLGGRLFPILGGGLARALFKRHDVVQSGHGTEGGGIPIGGGVGAGDGAFL